MTAYSRAQTGLKPYKAHYLFRPPPAVEGIALHWPAMSSPLRTVPRVMSSLRAWQTFHMDVRGWSDIAYQVAIDQAGNTYRLRGLRYRSAANGDESTNERYGALLLVVAIGEKPTQELIETTQRVIGRHRALFQHSKLIVGHGEIRPEPTACPGERIQKLIDDGKFEPTGGIR
jgi:hypothetical protein